MSSPASKFAVAPSSRQFAQALLKWLALGLAVLITFSVSVAVAPSWIGLLGAALATIMIAIAVIDYRSFRIPNTLNLIAFMLALVHAGAREPDQLLSALTHAALRGAALALVFLALREAYLFARGRDGLGLGDVKLAAVAGAWLGWLYIPIAVQLAAFGALTAFLLQRLVFARSITLTSRLPFGTFFAPAIWITWVLEQLFGI